MYKELDVIKVYYRGKQKSRNKGGRRRLKRDLVVCKNDAEYIKKIQNHVKVIKRVREKYRKSLADKTKMVFNTAKDSLEYFVDVQCALGEILDDCNW